MDLGADLGSRMLQILLLLLREKGAQAANTRLVSSCAVRLGALTLCAVAGYDAMMTCQLFIGTLRCVPVAADCCL